MITFTEILKKTNNNLKSVDNLNKIVVNNVIDEYKKYEEIKKIFEKKEIKLGDIHINYILNKKNIKFDLYQISFEIDILDRLIKNKIIRKEKQSKINQSFLTFEKLKEKIEGFGKNKNSLYNFLDEYLIMILKNKLIVMSDFNRRQLILKLCDRKSIKSEKYELSKKDLDRIET